MSATLNEDQMPGMFAQAEEGNLPEPTSGRQARTPARVTTVDFSRPSKFSKELERELRRLHEVFCRTAGSRMTGELRTSLDMSVVGLAQQTWSSATLGV